MKRQSGGNGNGNGNGNRNGTRSFSTSTRRLQQDLQHGGVGGLGADADQAGAAMVANMISQVDHAAAELHTGLKFPAPEPLPKSENFRTRYEPLLEQFTKLLMQDGKLTAAQKVCSLLYLK